MSKVSTASGLIRSVEDITAHPTRFQSEVAKETQSDVDQAKVATNTDAPTVPTLESAIKYFEGNAEGELRQLYLFTAMKLKVLLHKTATE